MTFIEPRRGARLVHCLVGGRFAATNGELSLRPRATCRRSAMLRANKSLEPNGIACITAYGGCKLMPSAQLAIMHFFVAILEHVKLRATHLWKCLHLEEASVFHSRMVKFQMCFSRALMLLGVEAISC